jgi:hypothetical protein
VRWKFRQIASEPESENYKSKVEEQRRKKGGPKQEGFESKS